MAAACLDCPGAGRYCPSCLRKVRRVPVLPVSAAAAGQRGVVVRRVRVSRGRPTPQIDTVHGTRMPVPPPRGRSGRREVTFAPNSLRTAGTVRTSATSGRLPTDVPRTPTFQRTTATHLPPRMITPNTVTSQNRTRMSRQTTAPSMALETTAVQPQDYNATTLSMATQEVPLFAIRYPTTMPLHGHRTLSSATKTATTRTTTAV